jgi:hypothetical protein
MTFLDEDTMIPFESPKPLTKKKFNRQGAKAPRKAKFSTVKTWRSWRLGGSKSYSFKDSSISKSVMRRDRRADGRGQIGGRTPDRIV